MSITAVVITLLLLAPAVWFGRNGAPLPKPFKARSCQGAGWRQSFSSASKEDIRSFLSVFVEAFAFRGSQKLKFDPNDSILGIYRALYPHKWLPDALELETLAMLVEKKYGIKFADVWNENLTLGQLFAATQGVSPIQE